jgi:hypothetical protein
MTLPATCCCPARADGQLERRQAVNQKICDFMNSHQGSISTKDSKNGQGLVAIYALHMLYQNQGGCGDFTPYEIADYIRVNELWFKLSIKTENDGFSVSDGSLEPYINEIDGVKMETMYSRDKVMREGRSRISNFIMNKLKSNVISPTRSHDLIRRLVDRSGQETYRVHFPRYLPPSNLSSVKTSKYNRIIRQSEINQRDQEFFDCW